MRPLITATLLATLAVGTTSCGNDTPPTATPPTSTPPSPTATSPSPTATPTVKPWQKHTKAGAVAAVDHWLRTFNAAQATGRTAELRSLSGRGCETCRRFITSIRTVHEAGGFIKGGRWELASFGRPQEISQPPITLPVTIDIAAYSIIAKPGANPVGHPATQVTLNVRLRAINGGWVVEELSTL